MSPSWLWSVALLFAAASWGGHAAPTFNVTEAVNFADRTWNCDGNSPPCHRCRTVSSGSTQDPYGCAPYVAHCLAAGGLVKADKCGDEGQYDGVKLGGMEYNLNVVAHQDPNCGQGNLCLLDYLKALGWRRTDVVRAGTVCAVVGEDNGQPVPYGHVVFGVAHDVVNAHNVAEYHRPIGDYTINECIMASA